jgi:hypothetical protein
MKHLLICSLVLLCLTSIFVPTFRAQNSELKIGTINNRNGTYLDGAGCYLKSPSTSGNSNYYIFLSEMGRDSNRGWLNINGRISTLKFVSSTWRSSQRLRKGSRFTETYRSGDITARITYVVTKMGEIESAEYVATIVVTKGNRSKTVKAIGECGA